MDFRQEIHICFRDELTLFDSQFRQHFLGNLLTFVFALIDTENQFKFQEISQAFHLVNMHPRLANEIENSGLLHFANTAQRLCEDIQ